MICVREWGILKNNLKMLRTTVGPSFIPPMEAYYVGHDFVAKLHHENNHRNVSKHIYKWEPFVNLILCTKLFTYI